MYLYIIVDNGINGREDAKSGSEVNLLSDDNYV